MRFLRNRPVAGIWPAVLLVLAFLLAGPAGRSSAADLRPVNFTHYSEVRAELKQGRLYRLHLGGELLRHCTSDCRDIRLFDADGREIPYVIVEHRIAGRKTESYRTEIVGFEEEGDSVQITVRMPEKAESVSTLKIETPDRDFRIACTLLGSSDQKVWTRISDDVLYDFSSQVDLRKTDLKFSRSSFRYYRLVLARETGKGQEQMHLAYNGLDFSVTGAGPRKMKFSGVRAETEFEGSEETLYDEVQQQEFSVKSGSRNETVLDMHTGLPFERIYLDVVNPYYFRRTKTVLNRKDGGRPDVPESWGMIYRFPVSSRDESRTYLEPGNRGKGDYRIVIENNNSTPLEIKGVRLAWKRRYLFFIPLRDSGGIRVSVGSDAADVPAYDLVSFVNQGNWHGLQAEEIALSGVVRTPDFKPATREDRRAVTEKVILVSVVVLLVIGMGFWLYTLIRKTSKKTA